MGAAELFLYNSLGWVMIFALSGTLWSLAPERALDRIHEIVGPHCVGLGSRFRRQVYEDLLKVRYWKRLLPHVRLLPRGARLDRLEVRNTAGLQAWIRESVRAEMVHWSALAALPFFAFWNPTSGVMVNGVFGIAANVPCILAQRYNRPRVVRLRERAARSS